ncbi:MAG: YggT family protein [Anaerolineales bacterium]
MNVEFWIRVIDLMVNLLSVLLLAAILVRYFLPPFNPIRTALDTLFEPMLAPIRRILPQTGMFDFSPIVLAVLIQLVGGLLVQLIAGLA